MTVVHDRPRECLHTATLARTVKELAAAKEANERLQVFAMELAERIFRAHEVLAMLAERKDKRLS